MSNEIQKAHMRSCLNAAITIWDLCEQYSHKDPSDDAVLELGLDELKAICAANFPTFTVDEGKLLAVVERLDFVIEQYGATSCGCFSFAHMLDHVFDILELPDDATAVH